MSANRPPRCRFERGQLVNYRLYAESRETRCGLIEDALMGLLLDAEGEATCDACIHDAWRKLGVAREGA
jgi:hypothetical protein